MIVVDASAVVEALLSTAATSAVKRRLFSMGESLHVPGLVDVEVAHVLRRYATTGQITTERGREAVEDLAAFPARRYPHQPLLRRIWDLRDNLSAYDATYVALAERLNATLVTRNRRLTRAAGIRALVEYIAG